MKLSYCSVSFYIMTKVLPLDGLEAGEALHREAGGVATIAIITVGKSVEKREYY